MSNTPEPNEAFDRWLRETPLYRDNPLERYYMKKYGKPARLRRIFGGALVLAGLILAEIFN